jgi:hypothetical protein
VPLRFDLDLGYVRIRDPLGVGYQVGIGLDLGWERTGLGELSPEQVVPTLLDVNETGWDLTLHGGVALGQLTIDGGAGYSWMNDNGYRLTGTIGYAIDAAPFWAIEQVLPQVSVEWSRVGYTLDGVSGDLERRAVLFRLVLVASSRS